MFRLNYFNFKLLIFWVGTDSCWGTQHKREYNHRMAGAGRLLRSFCSGKVHGKSGQGAQPAVLLGLKTSKVAVPSSGLIQISINRIDDIDMMTTGNVSRTKHSIWKENLYGCAWGYWAVLMGSIDFPLQPTAATQPHKYSLLWLCWKVQICLWCRKKGWWNSSTFWLVFLRQHGERKLQEKKNWDEVCPFRQWAEQRAHSIFSEEAQRLQWKLQQGRLQCQEILSVPSWNDMRRFFGH